MHLVIPTHLPSFGWYFIPTGHFSQKSLSENPRIGSPFLPTARPYILLPLTHGPPLLYWLGTSWWYLSLVCASLSCVSMACLLFMHLPWPGGSSTHLVACSWPLATWISLWAFVLYVLLPFWAGPCLIVDLSFSNPFFTPFASLLALLPCHFVIPAVLFFNSYFLGFFWACCMFFPYLIPVT